MHHSNFVCGYFKIYQKYTLHWVSRYCTWTRYLLCWFTRAALVRQTKYLKRLQEKAHLECADASRLSHTPFLFKRFELAKCSVSCSCTTSSKSSPKSSFLGLNALHFGKQNENFGSFLKKRWPNSAILINCLYHDRCSCLSDLMPSYCKTDTFCLERFTAFSLLSFPAVKKHTYEKKFCSCVYPTYINLLHGFSLILAWTLRHLKESQLCTFL
jgi:hypothetical protein